MISGERQFAANEVNPLADYLELPPTEVLDLIGGGLRSTTLRWVSVVGDVQAGAWREALEWEKSRWYPAPVAAVRRFAHLPQFGLEVVGPSMNELWPDGSIVICVKLIDLGRDATPGEKVVVLRRQGNGQIEATLKELRQDPQGAFWLWPRSKDPNFQQPWCLARPDAHDDNDDLRIVALVVGSYKNEA